MNRFLIAIEVLGVVVKNSTIEGGEGSRGARGRV
jgi:hypothetical protein